MLWPGLALGCWLFVAALAIHARARSDIFFRVLLFHLSNSRAHRARRNPSRRRLSRLRMAIHGREGLLVRAHGSVAGQRLARSHAAELAWPRGVHSAGA